MSIEQLSLHRLFSLSLPSPLSLRLVYLSVSTIFSFFILFPPFCISYSLCLFSLEAVSISKAETRESYPEHRRRV